METSLIQIGNSKGIHLSKVILDKYQITDKVEITLENDSIILKPLKLVRANWNNAFQQMHENGDDRLLIVDLFDETALKL